MPEKPFLEAGQIVATHGVRGEVRVQPWCDSAEQFAAWKRLYWDADGKNPVKVRSRAHNRMALTAIDGITTVEQAAPLRGRMLYVDRRDIRLPEGRHFVQDLIGLRVLDADTGEQYGTLTEVSQTGSNAVYHMATPNGEVLIPAIPSVVISIDTKEDILLLRPMEGLFE